MRPLRLTLGVMPKSGDAGMIGIHQREERGHNAEDQVQGMTIREGQRQAIQHASRNCDKGQRTLSLLKQHQEDVVRARRCLVFRGGVQGRIKHGDLIMMSQRLRRARQAGGEEGQHPVHDPPGPEGAEDLDGMDDSRGKAEQQAEVGGKCGRHFVQSFRLRSYRL